MQEQQVLEPGEIAAWIAAAEASADETLAAAAAEPLPDDDEVAAFSGRASRALARARLT